MDVLREVDPQGYFTSRLVGRSAYAWYQQARDILLPVNESATDSMRVDMPLPTERVDSATLARWSVAYAELDKHIQRMPFHPGEIWLVSLTAMLVCEFDFETSLMFVTNYGRDNDTSAAIVGAILGAMYGAEALPEDRKQSTLKASKELGIDLFRLSQRMTASVYANTYVRLTDESVLKEMKAKWFFLYFLYSLHTSISFVYLHGNQGHSG